MDEIRKIKFITGLTPLMHAVRTNNIVIVKKLLSMDPNLSLRDSEGYTAFHHLIGKSNF